MSGGATIIFNGPNLTNISGSVLTGGIYSAAGGGTIDFYSATFSILDADLTIGGSVSAIQVYQSGTYQDVQTVLTEIGATGILRLAGGDTFTPALAFKIDTGGVLYGNGTFAAAITDNGKIEANGGVLTIAGAVSGSASALIDNGAGLELGGADAGVVTFGSSSSLTLDASANFTGTLGGFVSGDALALQGISASSAAINAAGTLLTVTTTKNTKLTFKLANSVNPGATLLVTSTSSAALISFVVFKAPVISAPTSAVVQNGLATPIAVAITESTALTPGQTISVTVADTNGLLSVNGFGVTGNGTNGLAIPCRRAGPRRQLDQRAKRGDCGKFGSAQLDCD